MMTDSNEDLNESTQQGPVKTLNSESAYMDMNGHKAPVPNKSTTAHLLELPANKHAQAVTAASCEGASLAARETDGKNKTHHGVSGWFSKKTSFKKSKNNATSESGSTLSINPGPSFHRSKSFGNAGEYESFRSVRSVRSDSDSYRNGALYSSSYSLPEPQPRKYSLTRFNEQVQGIVISINEINQIGQATTSKNFFGDRELLEIADNAACAAKLEVVNEQLDTLFAELLPEFQQTRGQESECLAEKMRMFIKLYCRAMLAGSRAVVRIPRNGGRLSYICCLAMLKTFKEKVEPLLGQDDNSSCPFRKKIQRDLDNCKTTLRGPDSHALITPCADSSVNNATGGHDFYVEPDNLVGPDDLYSSLIDAAADHSAADDTSFDNSQLIGLQTTTQYPVLENSEQTQQTETDLKELACSEQINQNSTYDQQMQSSRQQIGFFSREEAVITITPAETLQPEQDPPACSSF